MASDGAFQSVGRGRLAKMIVHAIFEQFSGEISVQQRRVLLLDTKRSNPNHYICLAIERALRASPVVSVVVKADYLSAIDAAIENECNLLLAFDGEELDRDIVGRARSCPAR